MTTPEIMKKVAAKEGDVRDYIRCLQANICPECGEKMTVEVYGMWDQCSDHNCKACGFEAEAEVLY